MIWRETQKSAQEKEQYAQNQDQASLCHQIANSSIHVPIAMLLAIQIAKEQDRESTHHQDKQQQEQEEDNEEEHQDGEMYQHHLIHPQQQHLLHHHNVEAAEVAAEVF